MTAEKGTTPEELGTLTPSDGREADRLGFGEARDAFDEGEATLVIEKPTTDGVITESTPTRVKIIKTYATTDTGALIPIGGTEEEEAILIGDGIDEEEAIPMGDGTGNDDDQGIDREDEASHLNNPNADLGTGARLGYTTDRHEATEATAIGQLFTITDKNPEYATLKSMFESIPQGNNATKGRFEAEKSHNGNSLTLKDNKEEFASISLIGNSISVQIIKTPKFATFLSRSENTNTIEHAMDIITLFFINLTRQN